MKIKLVFMDWQNHRGESIYDTDLGVALSVGAFHAGTTFHGEIKLTPGQAFDLLEAFKRGCVPVFKLMK